MSKRNNWKVGWGGRALRRARTPIRAQVTERARPRTGTNERMLGNGVAGGS